MDREQDVKLNKDIAAFSYIWIMSVLVYFGRKNSPFIRHHSKQGLILFVLSIPLWFIPLIGRLLEVIVFAGMVMGFINAFQGQWADVPLVGPISRGEMSLGQAFKIIAKFLSGLFKQASESVKDQPTTEKKPDTSKSVPTVPSVIVPPAPPATTESPKPPSSPSV